MANELCDFFIKINPSIERSLKRQIVNTAIEYHFKLKDLLKAAKQEKNIKFFKTLPKTDNNNILLKSISLSCFYCNIFLKFCNLGRHPFNPIQISIPNLRFL